MMSADDKQSSSLNDVLNVTKAPDTKKEQVNKPDTKIDNATIKPYNNTTIPPTGDGIGWLDDLTIVRELGGGAFGSVYLVRDSQADVEYAVKGLPPDIRNNNEELGKILANFRLIQELKHPHIATLLMVMYPKQVVYFHESDRGKLRVNVGDPVVVMSYAKGITLSKWRMSLPNHCVPHEIAVKIVRQIAEALDFAHEHHILHRDIKPSNVMIDVHEDDEAHGDGKELKIDCQVLDFGLAAEIRTTMGHISKEIRGVCGTRPYMAPEQWKGEKQGPATDQYALAVLYYELVTGDLPFASVFETGDVELMRSTVLSRKHDLSKIPYSARAAVCRALAKKMNHRFKTCAEFVAALSNGKKKPMLKIVLGIAAVLVVGGLGVLAWSNIKSAQVNTPTVPVVPVTNVVINVVTNNPVPTPKPLPPSPQPTPVVVTNSLPVPTPSVSPVPPAVDLKKQEQRKVADTIKDEVKIVQERVNVLLRDYDYDAEAWQNIIGANKSANEKFTLGMTQYGDGAFDKAQQSWQEAQQLFIQVEADANKFIKVQKKREADLKQAADDNKKVIEGLRASINEEWRKLAEDKYKQGDMAYNKGNNAFEKGEYVVATNAWAVATIYYTKASTKAKSILDEKDRKQKARRELLSSLQRGSQFLPNPPERKPGEKKVISLPYKEGNIALTFVWCPPGKFLMGSPEGKEQERGTDERQHVVTLTQGFWIGETEVTRDQWKAVMGNAGFSLRQIFGQDGTFPVNNVSWNDCQEFCKKLSYYAKCTVALPTESQWEYACRAGTATPFSFGEELNGTQASCAGAEHPYPSGIKGGDNCYVGAKMVKSYVVNPWGIYDMHGNLYEWCADWYDEYPESDVVDPVGPSEGYSRVIRGGCWSYAAKLCRSACRGQKPPVLKNEMIGFRVCLITE